MTKKQTKTITTVFAIIAIGSMVIASVVQVVYMLGVF